MKIKKPKKLEKGDTIGLLSVSGKIRDFDNIKKAENYFKKQGYKVIISETTYKSYRYCTGSDVQRVKAIEEFFSDDKIDAIICTRGGYGTLRIINDIDYKIIEKNPKIFCGYSDITVLLLMILKRTGLVTFHGAMAAGDFGVKDISAFTEKSFFSVMEGEEKFFYADKEADIIHSGVSEGILWGGNLTTIASMAGTDFLPDEKFILFIEDINEPAYKTDRMLTQLFNIKKFTENIAGIAVGKFSGIDNVQDTYQVIAELSNKYSLPSCNGFKISHEKDKYTVPIGIMCEFSADKKVIQLKERYISNDIQQY